MKEAIAEILSGYAEAFAESGGRATPDAWVERILEVVR